MVEISRKKIELAKSYLDGSPVLYSILRSRGPDSTLVCKTEPDGSNSFFELIEVDAALDALAEYLESLGAPIFEERDRHDAFLDAFEVELKNNGKADVARKIALRAAFHDG